MKAVLDHVGIAVADLPAALAFYRDALGLDVHAPEEVVSQRVRAHVIPAGESALELLEATAPDSPIARYLAKRGPGLHHLTLRVDDIDAALGQLRARGVTLIDEQPRDGAEGARVAFVHPSSTHGVLVELKQPRTAAGDVPVGGGGIERHVLGPMEVTVLDDGLVQMDGGALFGSVPKRAWSAEMPADERNRVTLRLRPLLIRGRRTMLIDAGQGDQETAVSVRVQGGSGCLDAALAEAGVAPEDIDVVVATHLHAESAGGFTVVDGAGVRRPRFPRARYVVRRGEWEAAMRPSDDVHGAYARDSLLAVEKARALDFVDGDGVVMPGVRLQRTGGHTGHHQIVWVESGGLRVVYPGDLVPTLAHARQAWMTGLDLYPMDTLAATRGLISEVVSTGALVCFGRDPSIASAHLTIRDGHPALRHTS